MLPIDAVSRETPGRLVFGMPQEGWRCAWCIIGVRHMHELVCRGIDTNPPPITAGGGGGSYVSPLGLMPGETITIEIGKG